ncbi:unnamed protein product [Rhizoctonia solani]|uniref:DUF6535 domain-containing protein n=1 Tax=Rhizoctonia solani TaxID=456999 RepID=A0A8H2WYN5_9AGAM|nr:unnamed protein product [Rhizoctonia solani]
MATLLPGYLSQGNGYKKYLSSNDILPDIDEYGAELGKEAKVWKIYMDETDKWDAELVEGWNKSLDVILVFAALFSAISTAFLIESSNRLREDPADVSAETLLVISRTLLAMSNNTRPPDLDASPLITQNIPGFKPSRAAVLVNALWYLSLSLSVATSLLAMLAKDWCHSFTAGRIGHPCMQARRRQQKWNMIEQWKMQELLGLLPLLIHLALLLFAIGLSIDVWETNVNVAIPVVSISGIAIAFYTWSSLTAIWVDDFPYTTIISRIFRSEPAIAIYSRALQLTLLPLVRLFHSFVHKCYMKNNWLLSLDNSLWYLIRVSGNWKWKLRNYIEAISSCHSQKGNPEQDVITSSALSWLIKHCEVPNSVDVALQAIAGASMSLPRGPLEECKAAQQISQRLASWHLYKEKEPHAKNAAIKLYMRALSFLASNPPESHSFTDNVRRNMGELEVMVWDLHYESENRVATLIADGQFEPKHHNLSALRVGGMAVSQSLKLLKDGQDSDDIFKPILKLLQQHLQRTPTLHPAACLSLLNAIILVSACSASNKVTADLASMCMKILSEDNLPSSLSLNLNLAIPLVICTLLQRQAPDQEYPNKKASSARFLPYFRVLISQRSSSDRCLIQFVWSATALILSNPAEYNIDFQQDETGRFPGILGRAEMARFYAWRMLSGANSPIPRKTVPRSIVDRIEALQQLHTITQTDASGGEDYMFAVKSILYAKSDPVDRCCWGFLSQMTLPRPSAKLMRCLEHHEIIPMLVQHLEHNSPSIRFIASVQLWLLCMIHLHPPLPSTTSTEPRDDQTYLKLLELLRIYDPQGNDESLGATRNRLAQQIEVLCNDNRWIKDHNTIYIHRVYEYVLQSRGCPPGDPRWVQIDRKLGKVRPTLRRLDTFTSFPVLPRVPEGAPIVGVTSRPDTASASHLGSITISVEDGGIAEGGSPGGAGEQT